MKTNTRSLTESITSAEHVQAVNRPRRIMAQYDDGRIYTAPGVIGGEVKRLIDYSFGYVDQTDSQVDTICLDVNSEGVAVYPSRFLPMVDHPGLKKWQNQGIDYVGEMITAAHR